MTYPLVRYKIFHEKLISYVTDFGFVASPDGVCNGATRMGEFCFLAGMFDDYLAMLTYLNKTNYVALEQEIQQVRKKGSTNSLLSDKEKLLLDIPALIDGIASCQSVSLILGGKPFELTQKIYSRQEYSKPTELNLAVLPQALLSKGGLYEDRIPLTCFSMQEATDFFTELNNLAQEININFCCEHSKIYEAGGHATFFTYDAEKKGWYFFDINKQNYVTDDFPLIQDPVELANCLMSTGRGEFALAQFAFLSSGNDKSAMSTILDQVKQSETLNSAIPLTSEKINYINKSNPSQISSLLIEANDLQSIEEYINAGLVDEDTLICDLIDFGRLDLVPDFLDSINYAPRQELASLGDLIDVRRLALVSTLLERYKQIPRKVLSRVAALGDVSLMQDLLKRGGEIGPDEDEMHPLFCAALMGNKDMVQFLLDECHVPAAMLFPRDMNLLETAVFSGNTDLVNYVLSLNVFRLDVISESSPNYLSQAVKLGYFDIAELLLKAGALIDESTLPLAAQHGKFEMLQLCSTADFDLNEQYTCISYGTLLHQAAAFGQDNVVTWLLEQGAQTDIEDSNDFTPLYRAVAYKGTQSTIELLLEKGATLGSKYSVNRLNIVHIAAYFNRCDLIPWLLKAYPGDLYRTAVDGNNPLDYAVVSGHLDMCFLLIEAGLEISEKQIELAITEGHFELAFVLSQKLHNKNEDKALFMDLFKRTLPQMNNSQILQVYSRLTDLSDPTFGFIHKQRHEFFDNLRLGISKLSLEFTAPLWQTATFQEVAYSMADQYIHNLSDEDKVSEDWEQDTKLQSFIHADLGNFFHGKSKEREENLVNAIKQSLMPEEVTVPEADSNAP